VKQRTVKASGPRRRDAIAAAQWLAKQPGTPDGGVALMGWSNGGNTVLWTSRVRADLPSGLFQRFVAFYPGCATASRTADWRPSAPLLILVGANDDWTPAPPCRVLAARHPQRIELVVYPDSWHDFDAPGRPVRQRTGLATPPSGTGMAHTGSNPAARRDALARVAAFLVAQ
jgi:dienelactone hydrolase